ncbi:outer membrane protein assembly factor BamD [Idiomarina tyrosinivorans]|uniref:Outer membrane protein assembly factor BamD n=1 Tax=Idiomarina tyrosinivorans TaxID=1445662 RepID=A0A432ZSN6_9GAMM|nr:outer membrane protein assembly factor BamD [Idiomarina tyrosinivorans]RUO80893.1 outer membrane protein assembly factor BamD [Idiomarina tyrosinivorans]
MIKRHFVAAVVTGVFLSGCAGSPQDNKPELQSTSIEQRYDHAHELIAMGNLSAARDELSELSKKYPFGPYAHQIQLDLIYVYYKLDDTNQALATIDRFVQLNPNHEDMDYVLYMRGLVNQRAEYNTLQDMFGIDRADRDSTKSSEAFKDFVQLIKRFPDSEYAADAKLRLIEIKRRLARKELKAAQYYMERQAYLAAANRGKYIVEYYPNIPEVENALAIMVESYDQLNLPELKRDALRILKLNFPNNALAKSE